MGRLRCTSVFSADSTYLCFAIPWSVTQKESCDASALVLPDALADRLAFQALLEKPLAQAELLVEDTQLGRAGRLLTAQDLSHVLKRQLVPAGGLVETSECTGTSVTLWTGHIRYKPLAVVGA
jgi:hypothetical protein